MAEKLSELAEQSYLAISKTSPMTEEVKYHAQELLRLTNRKDQDLAQMIELAEPLPEYEILLSIPGIAETTATSIIGELETFVAFSLPIKSMPLSASTCVTMSLGTSLPRNTSPNEGILMPERFFSSVFTTSLQLVIPILVISQTFMRNEKDNRKRLPPSHIRLSLYIASSGQCITS